MELLFYTLDFCVGVKHPEEPTYKIIEISDSDWAAEQATLQHIHRGAATAKV